MDYLGLGVGYAGAAFLLFAVGRYFYLNIKKGRFWIALRNFLLLAAFVYVVQYVGNDWLHVEHCDSFDIRGCTD